MAAQSLQPVSLSQREGEAPPATFLPTGLLWKAQEHIH